MSTVTIAPHLQRALEAMSKDMSVEPQALVNQAVFAWLRINGYVTPGTAVHAEPVVSPVVAPVVAAPVASAAPVMPVGAVAPVAPLAPPPSAAAAASVAEPPVPVVVAAPVKPAAAPVTPAAVPVTPAAAPVTPAAVPVTPVAVPVTPVARVDEPEPVPAPDTALARMAEISADLAKLAKPWPEWVAVEEEEHAPNDEPAASDDEPEAPDEPASVDEPEALDDEPEALDDEPEVLDDEPEVLDDEPEVLDDEPEVLDDEPEVPLEDDGAPVDEPTPPEGLDEPTRGAGVASDLDMNTGETEVPLPERAPEDDEEPPAESTVVLRSVPIVLYLEREGEEPVRVATERFIIGRGPQCDLIIDSPRVSREHLAVTRSGVQYFIEDLNSSNGTWLGEERISTRELESGDVINLGNEPVTFWLRAE